MKTPFELLLPIFHEISPYEGFNSSVFEEDLQGWGSESPVFDVIIERIQPQLIIEVGTWKGASAVRMADILKKNKINAAIICVDTWLGEANHWYRPEWRSSLQLKNGFPNFYYQFLANVMKHGHEDTIIPVPQTSRSACDWFRKSGLLPNIIYLDGSHEEALVSLDCHDFWELLAPGGVLFGDDYGGNLNKGVKRAVDKFCKKISKTPTIIENKWVLTKPV